MGAGPIEFWSEEHSIAAEKPHWPPSGRPQEQQWPTDATGAPCFSPDTPPLPSYLTPITPFSAFRSGREAAMKPDWTPASFSPSLSIFAHPAPSVMPRLPSVQPPGTAARVGGQDRGCHGHAAMRRSRPDSGGKQVAVSVATPAPPLPGSAQGRWQRNVSPRIMPSEAETSDMRLPRHSA